jgi:flagellum-specific peptidoglycan hydrolase FlgJ
MSCGPKKGVVTKKKNQKERAETVEKSSLPASNKKVQDKDVGTTTNNTAPKRTPKSNSAIDIYIAAYADISMTEMRRYKIPASITLAQGILESGSGNGRLAREANNHFGIKCHDWKGPRIYHDDDRSKECFRKYKDPFESYEDHSKFLTQRRRYAELFDLKPDDYKGWARGLKKAGYATDRQYPSKLIGLIEKYSLYEFDKEVLKGASKSRSKKESQSAPQKAEVTYVNYTVKQGDTLYSLSRQFGMSVEQIKALNGLNSSSIDIGQILKFIKE